jgi:hypothetical protein
LARCIHGTYQAGATYTRARVTRARGHTYHLGHCLRNAASWPRTNARGMRTTWGIVCGAHVCAAQGHGHVHTRKGHAVYHLGHCLWSACLRSAALWPRSHTQGAFGHAATTWGIVCGTQRRVMATYTHARGMRACGHAGMRSCGHAVYHLGHFRNSAASWPRTHTQGACGIPPGALSAERSVMATYTHVRGMRS